MSPIRTSEKVEYPAGYTVHGQKLRLVGERQDGRWTWSIFKDQASQRDQADVIRGLTADNIRKMLRAVEEDGR